MTEKEKMLAGEMYDPLDAELVKARWQARENMRNYNTVPPLEEAQRQAILKSMLNCKDQILIEPPFIFDYGTNIEVGENFMANFNLTVLDCAPVKIGDNVMIAPNVSIFTATHPVHAKARNAGREYASPITIGNNVWIGGSSVICPGVTIGENAVIGAGSVVTKDIPSDCVAAGNPCRVLRYITEDDFKKFEI